MSSPTETVLSFCAAWSRLDIEELLGYFTEDAVYHNMPGAPAVGRAAVRRTIEHFLRGWRRTDWEVVATAACGNVVFAERIDRTDTHSGKHVDLAVVGVFEVADGKIRAWRDYFDLASYTRAVA
ncbi:MAG: nuclear transport factor 2 family protein [Rubrivivax sp.]|nr:nuclear transport factor 2 family protein [Rubrivivax sp.]MCL4697580.1 nuclear transport factor 2 family protein [Burkholderiaceae bacterium]